ncbi:MAG: tRNA pseudouridine(38-40) synthase TruA [Desulforhopalus sp.]
MIWKTSLRRYKLLLEYDGTNFSGWQKQKDARTVQGDLLKGAERIFGEVAMDVQGCGRTDGGVHALQYAAHLEVSTDLSPEMVAEKLNHTLPKDLAVLRAESVDPRFHARHNCVARSYIYQLRTRKSAFAKRYNWWIREKLDMATMQRAGQVMVGMHDFAAFAEKQELKKSTQVLVHMVQLIEDGDLITVRVVGSHFLWRMVRRMVGILVEAGCQRLTEDDIRSFLITPSTVPFNHTAPSAGLFFERAFYNKNELQKFIENYSTI